MDSAENKAVTNKVSVEVGSDSCDHYDDELTGKQKWQVLKIILFVMAVAGALLMIGAWLAYILISLIRLQAAAQEAVSWLL